MQTKQTQIEALIRDNLQPTYFEVINESFMHQVPANAETHFKIIIVSQNFTGTNLVQRHQQLYALLKDVAVHAISMHLYTPSEWEKNTQTPSTPNCKRKENNATANR